MTKFNRGLSNNVWGRAVVQKLKDHVKIATVNENWPIMPLNRRGDSPISNVEWRNHENRVAFRSSC